VRTATSLNALGLRPGEEVRFQAHGGGRWRRGVVSRRERDGSVTVADDDGATRSLAVERIEVRRAGPRGGRGWELLTVRASRAEQLRLL